MEFCWNFQRLVLDNEQPMNCRVLMKGMLCSIFRILIDVILARLNSLVLSPSILNRKNSKDIGFKFVSLNIIMDDMYMMGVVNSEMRLNRPDPIVSCISPPGTNEFLMLPVLYEAFATWNTESESLGLIIIIIRA